MPGYATARSFKKSTAYTTRYKPIADKLLAMVLLIVLLPVMAILALAIKLTSRGPIIFKQHRIGKDGNIFTVFKFRTMWEGSHLNGNLPAAFGDKRVTPLGKLLRKYHWDEIPQLVNILQGTMSFIGPRPLSPEDKNLFFPRAANFYLRQTVMPGLTCSTQFRWNYDYSPGGLDKRLDLDLEYIRACNPWSDLRILIRTLRLLLP